MANKINFFKGQEDTLKEGSPEKESIKKIQDTFTKIFDGKNLSFLLGSGCSSYKVGDKEVGILTMQPLAKKFYDDNEIKIITLKLKKEFNLDVTKGEFKNNLEFFLGSLHSIEYFYDSIFSGKKEEERKDDDKEKNALIKEAIKAVRDFLIREILNKENIGSGNDKSLNSIYEQFYRKLLFRNSNLPKPNIFTTNYDLYSEKALDKLGIHYVNGFSGGINKYFNPTIFNYALAEKMDLSQTKWSVIDNFVYLYKIHGSINWVEDKNNSKLFKVKEIQEPKEERLANEEVIMIHPTPLKQNASLGSPYSDLFREFQKKLMQTNNVLITVGYSFSDEHVNNLIYQAFTIPSFRLIVLGSPFTNSEIEKLKSLNDPRIWIICGSLENNDKLHYFKGFVENILPDLSNDEIDNKIENVIEALFTKTTSRQK